SFQVTVHRVVNIVEKRNPMSQSGMELDRGFNDDKLYGGPRGYQDVRDPHGEGSYPPNDHRFFDSPNYGGFRRYSPPPRNVRQAWKSSRGGGYFRNRGRGSGPPSREDRNDYRISPPVKRDRSPGSREAQRPVRSGSNTSNRSFSPDRDKGYGKQPSQKKHKPSVPASHTPSSSAEGSPHSSGSSKEKTAASVAETEEVAAASMEPKLTPEDDFKARRSQAIKAKALEIEKVHYRQDCETFRTVVKMLVAKEPSLDNVLQAPLDENLLEMKHRCLDSLRHFVKELDEIINGGGDKPGHDSTHKLCIKYPTQVKLEEDLEEQKGRQQPGNAVDSTSVPAENQEDEEGGQEGGKQTGNIKDSTPSPEIHTPMSQESLATPQPEDSYSKPMEVLSRSLPSLAQQGPVEGLSKRLQLYSCNGGKFSCTQLLNPKTWKNITYARPGWIPDYLPFLKTGDWYWELKANSTVVSTDSPPCGKGQNRVPCGVTCYTHVEGPWCEVQSQNGTRICILATHPRTAWTPPLIGQGTRAESKTWC
ncbi:Periphilin-1, partial [Nibea albiflora]